MDTNTANIPAARNSFEIRETLKVALVAAAKSRTFARKPGSTKLAGRRPLNTGELAAKIGARCAFVRRWGDHFVATGLFQATYNPHGSVSGYCC